jgi:selenide,water dikinase
VLPGAEDLAIAGAVPGGTKNNAAFVSKYVTYDVSLAEHQKAILCDAQTSGGLLFAIARDYRQQALDAFAQANVNVWEVGQIDSDDTSPLIHVSL